MYDGLECAFLCSPEMKQILHSGTSLIVDRYAFSGVAFTAAKKVSLFVHYKVATPAAKEVYGIVCSIVYSNGAQLRS